MNEFIEEFYQGRDPENIVITIGDLDNFLNSQAQQYVLLYLYKNDLKTVNEISEGICRSSKGLYRNSHATIKALINAKYIEEFSGKYRITQTGRDIARWINSVPIEVKIGAK